MRVASPILVFGLLIALVYTLATTVQLRAVRRAETGPADGAFKKLLGDGRRLFAGQFVEMADVYLHSGYYPSIFDRREPNAPKAVSGTTEDHDDGEEPHSDEYDHGVKTENHKDHEQEKPQTEHEKAMDFMGPPRDWLEGFIRRFRVTKHSHLEAGEERELLPWLKVAIELDPQAINTYTITAFWLRSHLKNEKAAEEVLREGIRNNPGNAEILFELGLLYKENYQDIVRARNLWQLALRRWEAQSAETKQAEMRLYGKITANLARLESGAGNWQRAIEYFQLAKLDSPNPAAIQKQIDELQVKISQSTNSSPPRLLRP